MQSKNKWKKQSQITADGRHKQAENYAKLKKKGIFSRYYSVLKLHGKSMDNRQAQKY